MLKRKKGKKLKQSFSTPYHTHDNNCPTRLPQHCPAHCCTTTLQHLVIQHETKNKTYDTRGTAKVTTTSLNTRLRSKTAPRRQGCNTAGDTPHDRRPSLRRDTHTAGQHTQDATRSSGSSPSLTQNTSKHMVHQTKQCEQSRLRHYRCKCEEHKYTCCSLCT